MVLPLQFHTKTIKFRNVVYILFRLLVEIFFKLYYCETFAVLIIFVFLNKPNCFKSYLRSEN